MSQAQKGFTRVELVVLLGTAAITLAFLIPAMQSGREAARRNQCKDHMKQIALALLNYHDANGVFPPGWLAQTTFRMELPHGPIMGYAPLYRTGVDVSGVAWTAFLLPYCGFQDVYNRFDFDRPMTDSKLNSAGDKNSSVIRQPVGLFRCPTDSDQRNAGAVQSSRGCGPGCTETSQGGTAPPKSVGGGWQGPRQKAEWVKISDTEVKVVQPKGPVVSTAVEYPVTGDLSDRTAPAAISNYLGNSGPWMADGKVADIDLMTVGKVHLTPSPPPPDFGGVMFERSRVRIRDITDGTANTALVAEHTGATCLHNPSLHVAGGTACYAWWANADSFLGDKNKTTVASDVVFSSANGVNGGNNLLPGTDVGVGIPGDISSRHPGGANVAFCDGSVRFLGSKVNAALLRSVCERNDGRIVSLQGLDSGAD